jgi:hypothetical protein
MPAPCGSRHICSCRLDIRFNTSPSLRLSICAPWAHRRSARPDAASTARLIDKLRCGSRGASLHPRFRSGDYSRREPGQGRRLRCARRLRLTAHRRLARPKGLDQTPDSSLRCGSRGASLHPRFRSGDYSRREPGRRRCIRSCRVGIRFRREAGGGRREAGGGRREALCNESCLTTDNVGAGLAPARANNTQTFMVPLTLAGCRQ